MTALDSFDNRTNTREAWARGLWGVDCPGIMMRGFHAGRSWGMRRCTALLRTFARTSKQGTRSGMKPKEQATLREYEDLRIEGKLDLSMKWPPQKWTSLMSALAQTRSAGVQDLREAFDLIPKAGVMHYNTLLKGYAVRHSRLEAEVLIDKMTRTARKAQAGVKPDVVTFTTLMKLYVDTKDAKGAETVLERMTQTGVKPDVVTFSSLLKLYVDRKDAKGAEKVLESMTRAGVKPDKIIALERQRRGGAQGSAGSNG